MKTILVYQANFSIIGFDDMPIARYLIPKLTTIRYPIDLMATYAANLALSLVDNEVRTPSTIQFNPTLVRRFFCGIYLNLKVITHKM